ncbi:ragulator complex protein LAMTOR3-A-like [Uloborus diversus]|uniref:ragulator complex protein LAMTOR3-A-like n=1 Tax=Uloborus diversus TaxID=327109 RepID=UPI0024095BD3|nr:ragulator complex protein LAMTOR3-A-like [Uloborus diversus]
MNCQINTNKEIDEFKYDTKSPCQVPFSSLIKDAKKFLQDIIKKVDGLHAILITDRDGIPVIKVNTADTPEVVSKAGFLASLSLAVEQAGKLGSGRNKRIICMFSSFQVVLFNKSPLMITLIATSKANTGFLLNIESELSSFIEDLQRAIEDNQSLI